MIDRHAFFDRIRQPLFDGRLRQSQVDGLTALLDGWERDHAGADRHWLAYALATAHHETGRELQPIREEGSDAYLTRLYDIGGERPALARRMGNIEPGDGVRYCGRGFVQLTWRNNYAAMSPIVCIDLVRFPERALEIGPATEILFHGMIAGSFTGAKLGDYFDRVHADWKGARRIVNGSDHAALIAGYARAYANALA
ncbi:MAG TPA: hypothetical protein VG894_06370 [Bauldia sp.]|nr:hypothetical protein [Bauldia sp.]